MHSTFIQELERDIRAILPAIEKRGLRVDTEKLQGVIADLRRKRELAETKVYDLLGTSERINLNSSGDLVHLLARLSDVTTISPNAAERHASRLAVSCSPAFSCSSASLSAIVTSSHLRHVSNFMRLSP